MVPASHVVSVHDVSNLYKVSNTNIVYSRGFKVPLLMITQNVPALVLNVLKIHKMPPESLPLWERLSDRVLPNTDNNAHLPGGKSKIGSDHRDRGEIYGPD